MGGTQAGAGGTNKASGTSTNMSPELAKAFRDQAKSNQDIAKALKDMDERISRSEKASGKSSSSTPASSRRGSPNTSYLDDLARRDDLFSSHLSNFIEASVMKYGGMIDYGVSELENRASVTIKLQAEKLTELALETGKFIGSKSIQQIFGNADAARRELDKIYDANTYYLNKIGKDYKDSEDAGLEAMANSMVVQRALRINAEDFSKIISIQMSDSKKFTSQVFEDIAYYAGEYSNRTSASIFQITNQLTRALGDFDTFGGASVESLGKLAGFMGELQMDTQDVAGLIKNMQSFQGSVGIVRDLAGAFGAVIDPAKLMGDAIKDPAEALNTIRQSLLDAGHTSENLGFKLTLLANKLNVSSDTMRRFLNEEIDAQSVLQNSVKESEKSADISQKYIEQTQKQIVDNRSISDTFQDVIETRSETMFQNTFKRLNQFKSDMNQFITESGSILTEITGEKGLKKLETTLNTYLFDDTKRKAAKEELDKMLSVPNLTGVAAQKAKALKDMLDEVDASGDLDLLKDYLDNKQELKYKVDFDGKDVEETYKYLNASPEIKTFHDLFNEPYDYVRTNSTSKFHKDSIANAKGMRTAYDHELGYLNKAFDATFKDRQAMVSINADKALEDSEQIKSNYEQIEEIKNSTQSNDPVIAAINQLGEDMKKLKFEALVTNDATYKISLGNDIKSSVTEIVDERIGRAMAPVYEVLGVVS